MGLKNFIQPGYYSKINKITIDFDTNEIYFSLKTLTEKDGINVFSPMNFVINKNIKIQEYLKANPAIIPDEIVYPQLCVDREANVPMWTTETDEEKAPYYAAKQKYNDDIINFNIIVNNNKNVAIDTANINNDYTKFFSKTNLFKNNNPVKCAYLFIKNHKGFEGVVDVIEE